MTKITLAVLLSSLLLLASCSSLFGEEWPVYNFELINKRGYSLTVQYNSSYVYYLLPENLSLQNNESFTWTHVDYAGSFPLLISYDNGETIKCVFDETYEIIFLADAYHTYNFAYINTYSEKKIT